MLDFCSIGALKIKMRCQRSGTIYIDGNQVGTTSKARRAGHGRSLQMPGPLLFTVAITFIGIFASIASFSNDLKTDNAWRCSHDNVDEWYDENSDDSDWDRAYVLYENDGSGGWLTENRIPDYAKWIWASNIFQADKRTLHSYGRWKLSELTAFDLSLSTPGNAKSV